ncbi:hypothetical protein FA15DRAFT_690893 [Coprinopsis marcescibilis]|uniref:Uncharacterized protein n=1 Tax=Coprinopsis marcescibilis TaxID=230819 RepID=A0A5C3LCC7_COPMA|nr:hypothetical protein FA15DRAFT_690893 [Coprinopsis marcescibilis]
MSLLEGGNMTFIYSHPGKFPLPVERTGTTNLRNANWVGLSLSLSAILLLRLRVFNKIDRYRHYYNQLSSSDHSAPPTYRLLCPSAPVPVWVGWPPALVFHPGFTTQAIKGLSSGLELAAGTPRGLSLAVLINRWTTKSNILAPDYIPPWWKPASREPRRSTTGEHGRSVLACHLSQASKHLRLRITTSSGGNFDCHASGVVTWFETSRLFNLRRSVDSMSIQACPCYNLLVHVTTSLFWHVAICFCDPTKEVNYESGPLSNGFPWIAFNAF